MSQLQKHTPIEFLLKYKLYFLTQVPRYPSNKTKTWIREMNLGIRGERGGRDISLKNAKLHAFLDLDCQSISRSLSSPQSAEGRNFLRFLFVFQIVLNSPIVKLSDVSELCIHQKVFRPHLRKIFTYLHKTEKYISTKICLHVMG